MFIANDMALLTFLPLGYFVLSTANKKRYMAFTFIMQNIAANLGGMLTPFGNPQNLYLYTKYQIPDLEFIKIMAPPFLLSVTAITVCCIAFIKPEPLALCDERVVLDPKKTILYLALFVLAIVIVFRTIPYWIGLIIIPGVLLFADRKALKMVDYGLLFTFVLLFCFCRKYGKDRSGKGFVFHVIEKEHPVIQRRFMSGHQQCPVGNIAVAVYRELSGTARGR